MARSQLYEGILELLRQRAASGQLQLSRHEVVAALEVPPATASRYLRRLESDGMIERFGKSSGTRYQLPGVQAVSSDRSSYTAGTPFRRAPGGIEWSPAARDLMRKLDAPLAARIPVNYRRKFVDDYRPNETFLLSEPLASALYREGQMPGQQPAGTYARNVVAPLLIDLSFSSSRLEGNRYSRADTEVLFQAGRADPNDLDATMLLNHKQAIEFLVDEIPLYGVSVPVVQNVHTLLMQGLLQDDGALGTIRQRVVNISNTGYVPSNVPQLLAEMLTQIVGKARDIKNPVEAAFFLWLNIAYLQPFEDGNKRTSRLSANIPLLLYNCAPLSFLDVRDEDYARARMGVYELLDTSIAADLFAWTYRRSIAKYAAQLAAAGQPDPFRATYRQTIYEVVNRVVRDRESLSVVIAALPLEPAIALQLRDRVKADLSRIGEHNFARYRLRMSELQQWLADGRPVGN